jgi:thiol-disulfide isomerase/thioredoxin
LSVRDRARVAAAIGAVALLAACSGAGNRGTTTGFVSGDGSIQIVDVADRKDAPVLEGEGLDGRPLSTADFAGKTIVVNLWGPWCAPCRAEAPNLEKVAAEYAAKDVQFVGIVTRSKDPSFADEGGQLELGFNDSLPTTAIPTTWVIDSEGRVAARVIDKLSASTLANLIDDVQASTTPKSPA